MFLVICQIRGHENTDVSPIFHLCDKILLIFCILFKINRASIDSKVSLFCSRLRSPYIFMEMYNIL